ncbi:cation-independent mannose-6-phosphate receptor-like [Gigantopelta aegis]|uniref:cation-independent mannose-6-phosphate receptor-like n=1 Tax=Gigantopelta aegis TaxID=1735272 RepID=UPI001B889CE4|nr:cation-independent mannose-6-phosphate receptor-like [Gigantopelta aegis]
MSDDGNYKFKINLCEMNNKDGNCPNNAAICRMDKDGSHAVSFGNQTVNVDTRKNSSEAELTVIYHGAQCSQSHTELYTTTIHFRCGKYLGSPNYLGTMGCAVFFQWESIVFCTDMKQINEVPCFVYLNGARHDLSPLIKKTGGYLVDSSNDRELYINVCRDINGVGSSDASKCPVGSASCRVIGGAAEDMGQLNGSLQKSVDGNLILKYVSPVKPDSCLDKPTTTITFVCPQRGGSKDPLLLDDHNCQNKIEWTTEYACNSSILTSNGCQLTYEHHNIDFDLSPLTNDIKSDTPYLVNVTDGSDHYEYFINVCQELGIPCPVDTQESVCQLKADNSTFGKNLGTKDSMKLRYSDGELTLTYSNGDACHTHFHRETIIVFHCNKTAENDGKGKPVFTAYENCTYMFEWQTKYACIDHSVDDLCRVRYQGHRYDLSSLVRKTGSNWVALDGIDQTEKQQYFINVCHDILKTGDANGCHSDSAVCVRADDGGTKSIGKFTTGPTFDPTSRTLTINYTDGHVCNSKGRKSFSVITFICKPGDLESGPVLMQKMADGCMFEFEWYTAAACVLSQKTGTHCKVFDDEAGYHFDLSRLTKKTGEYYSVTDKSRTYDYFLNVCGPVTGTRCDNGHVPTAACQVKKNGQDSDVHNTGKPNGDLLYFDGMIKLNYSDGDPYSDSGHTPRQTEIAFLCDLSKGMGQPELIEEKNHVYAFKWYTAYACPVQPVECIFVDKVTNYQYDLSRLSMFESQENWAVLDDSNPLEKHKFYINVCRPVNPVHLVSGGTVTCDAFAAACETKVIDGKEVLVHANLGKAKVGPIADGNQPGHLLLEYTDGDDCTDMNGKPSKMKTTIHFICSKGKVSSGSSPPHKISNCEYSFIWETEAACRIDHVQNNSQSCSIKDPNSDFVFGLAPLKKRGNSFYEVLTSDKRSLRFNICGPVSASSCDPLPDHTQPAVCEYQPQRRPPLARVSHTLEYSDDGQLFIKYEGNRNRNTGLFDFILKISFTCSRTVSNDTLEFVQQEEQTYMLKIATPLACPAQAIDCTVIDAKGQQYDLSPLARTDSNWEVPDSRDTHKNLKYLINVCRPVVQTASNTSCPGGPVGACQVGGSHSFSMGYIQSKPTVAVDGTITLRYRGGDACHVGTPKEAARSTRIDFICSSSEHEPVFMGETEVCEYLFNWKTPSACPQQRPSVYRLGEGQCPRKPNDKLVYDAGEITLTYTEGKSKCHGKYNRTTVITFVCDHSSDGKDGPHLLAEHSDCTYQFEWPTNHACPPYKVTDCSIIDKDGKHYDLSQLSRSSDNYEYLIQHENKKFIINVCRSLVHQKDQTCPFNAAACMIDLAEHNLTKRYHNIGELTEHPVKIEDGKIVLKYENGETCMDGQKKATTTIIMVCSPNSFDTHPLAHFAVGDCDHHFMWTTKAACPISSQVTQSGNCTVRNPATGYSFDLNILKKAEGYVAKSPKGYNYTINVCAALNNSPCGPNSGSCQHEPTGDLRYFDAGNFTSNLQFKDGILMLNYSGGARCHHNNFERTSIISFICSENAGQGSPVYIDSSDGCLYYFNWHTELACEKQVKCSVDVGGNYTVDLSPLIKRSGHHLAVDMAVTSNTPRSLFYINICRPLNSVQGILCPAGASACMVRDELPPKSLGKISGEPIVGPRPGEITLVYDHGDPCKKNPSKNMSSRIVFTCKPGASEGTPELDAVTEDCQYVFVWETEVVCHGDTREKENKSCKYTNPFTKLVYDLSSLNNPIEVPVSRHSRSKYYVQVCGHMDDDKLPGCRGSAVCLVNGTQSLSFGKADQAVFEMASTEILKLTINGGKECKYSETGKSKTEILFQCDYTADRSKPTLMQNAPCNAVFIWKTKLVCPPVIEDCSLVYRDVKYDLEILSREKGSWNHTDSQGNIYWINICQGLHGNALHQGCPAHASVCRKNPHRPNIDMLGRLDSQKLYMDSDGQTIVLEYTEGEPACSHNRRRSNNPQAKTIIKFKCAETVGGPVFIPRSENEADCVFEFEWKTRIACAKESQAMPVSEVNGIITDPKSGGTIDLHKFNNANGNHFALESDGKNHFMYVISLDGHLKVDQVTSSSSVCIGAAVCQEKRGDANYHRNLGSYKWRKYFIKDDQLEVKYTSTQQCTDKNGKTRGKNITSTIIFHCQPEAVTLEPELMFKSRDCSFLFHWDTEFVCVEPGVVIEPAVPSGGGNNMAGPASVSRGNRGKTIAAVVGVFASAIVVCFGLVYFHKQERRIAFASKVKRVLRCNRQTERHFKYSVLSQAEDEDPEVEDFLNENDIDNDVTCLDNTHEATRVRSYHDDSDDDLLE